MKKENFENENEEIEIEETEVEDGNEDEMEVEVYTLTDEEGVESDFELLGRHDMDGQSYVALAPIETEEESDAEEGSFIVLKVVEDEDGEESFETIDDDDEFDKIADVFEDLLMSEIDYDEEE